MNRIAAIAALAVRQAVRSRLLVSILVLLLATVLGLPLTVKGDGTPPGRVRVMIAYTLGLSQILIGMATLWAACGSVAQEVEGRQIRLVAVKPVRRVEIWLGKWLGLCLLDAMLLALAGGALYGWLAWATRPSRISSPGDERLLRESILTARRRLVPLPDLLDEAVAARALRIREAGAAPADLSEAALREQVRQRLRQERAVIPPDGIRRWVFSPARRADASEALTVRFRLRTSLQEENHASGTWQIGIPAEPAIHAIGVTNLLDGLREVRLPAGAVREGQPIVLTFTNGGRERSCAIALDPDNEIELLRRAGGFGPNLARALVVMLAQLALLAALGVTLSTLFSFPVATFAAAAVIVMAAMTHYASVSPPAAAVHGYQEHSQTAWASWLERAGERLLGASAVVVEPTMAFAPAADLADGIRISWSHAAVAVGWLAVLYPAILALGGGYALARRELAPRG